MEVKRELVRSAQFIIMVFIIILAIRQTEGVVIEEIHTHEECLKQIETLENYNEYYRGNNPDTDPIKAREFVESKIK